MAYKGRFRPKNVEKYKGDWSSITYRSSWELHFFKYCDRNPKILHWSSEEIIIPYVYMGRKHRYFPDVWIEFVYPDNTIGRRLIEIKPHAEKFPPRRMKNQGKYLRKLDTYAKNQAKWKTAKAFCELNGIEWAVYDEYDLQLKKPTSKMLKEGMKNGLNCR